MPQTEDLASICRTSSTVAGSSKTSWETVYPHGGKDISWIVSQLEISCNNVYDSWKRSLLSQVLIYTCILIIMDTLECCSARLENTFPWPRLFSGQGFVIPKASIIEKAGRVAPKIKSAHAFAATQSSCCPANGDGNRRPILWLDSGASHHVVGDARILTNLRDPPGRITVTVADGSSLPVTKVGDIRTQHFQIEDVWLVPGLQMNLVSVRQLARMQIITIFFEHHAVLMQGPDEIGGAISNDDTPITLCQMRYLTEN